MTIRHNTQNDTQTTTAQTTHDSNAARTDQHLANQNRQEMTETKQRRNKTSMTFI